MAESFVQSPPRLGNQYDDDSLLRHYLRRSLPPDILYDIEPQLRELGSLAGGELYELQLHDRQNEPRLIQWDAWGRRIDRIELTPLWQKVAPLAAQHGLVAIPYERLHGNYSRLHQFAAAYLFHPSSDLYTCPLAMSDGAASALLGAGKSFKAAVTRLTSRDPAQAWTSGQWMTETTGGSDVGGSATRASRDTDGHWRLYGRKWFTSAINSQMALALARPEGNAAGSSQLALFYVETRTAEGRSNGIRVDRLKDKLGSRKLPTAELQLEGAVARTVAGTAGGTRAIAPMLQITRVWNSVTAVAFMRRGMALARSYAKERRAFGHVLEQLPLHRDTLALLEAQTQAAFLLTFELVTLIGQHEAGQTDEQQDSLLRLLTPIAKLLTAKQAVSVLGEIIESFGGAGYVEDTGVPALLRDAQVLPIWEGTTNVLALDALLRGDIRAGLAALRRRIETACRPHVPALADVTARAESLLRDAVAWLERTTDGDAQQAGARRFAFAIGHALQMALLIEQARWDIADRGESGSAAAARLLAWQSSVGPIAARLDDVAAILG